MVDPEKVVASLAEATVRQGSEVILNEVDLEVVRGSRSAILGPNGCGKTTLLSVLAGRVPVETGDLITPTQSLGWLRQEATAGSTSTVVEEAMSEMCEAEAQRRLDKATAVLTEAKTPEEIAAAQEDFDEAISEFEACGGYDMEAKASKVLLGLNFNREDFDRPCSELSGGWQMKVALARALLREPELLLLDEPTNHMDSSAKSWLASYLANDLPRSTTLLLVTHDRQLLDEIRLTNVVEISEKRILNFQCPNIKGWEEQRKSLAKRLGKEIESLTKQIKDAVTYANKWGAQASFASLVQARLKEAEKNKKEVRRLSDLIRGLPADEVLGDKKKGEEERGDGMLPLAARSKVYLKLPESPLLRGGPVDGVLLSVTKASLGYAPGTPTILGDIDLSLRAGNRTALVGPNGVGKSTLLRALAGTLELRDGKRKLGEGSFGEASVGLFTQDLAQDLPADWTPVDYVIENTGCSSETARAALGALGLKSEAHMSPIGALSGGEKGRVALAVFTTRPTDVLLMDEPTNHLDRVAVTALAEGLRGHTGAVLVSTHDQPFIDALQVNQKAQVTPKADGKPGSIQVTAPDAKAKAAPAVPAEFADAAGAVAKASDEKKPAAQKAAPKADDAKQSKESAAKAANDKRLKALKAMKF